MLIPLALAIVYNFELPQSALFFLHKLFGEITPCYNLSQISSNR